jgi:hypothetical protein
MRHPPNQRQDLFIMEMPDGKWTVKKAPDSRDLFMLETSVLLSMARLLTPQRERKMGRPVNSLRDLVVYREVCDARTRVAPRRLKNRKPIEEIEPLPLSWDRARAIAKWNLEQYWHIHLSEGAIRAAYGNGKKVADLLHQKMSALAKSLTSEPVKKPAKKS